MTARGADELPRGPAYLPELLAYLLSVLAVTKDEG